MEQTPPSIWLLVRSWLTPSILFLLLNLVIGTIALTSKYLVSQRRPDDPAGDVHSLDLRRLRSGDFFFDSDPAATAMHHESDTTDNPSQDPKVSEKEEEHRFCWNQSEITPTSTVKAAPVSPTELESERSQ